MHPPLQIAEIQGLYGPVSFSEKLIQRIWLRRDFQSGDIQTASGKTLKIIHPGRWNLQEGPDFLGAKLELDGSPVQGDVEIHFYEQDWQNHGHETQASFDQVVLHVIVFPPKQRFGVTTLTGKKPETLYLLSYLLEDLEAYATNEALEAWEGRDTALLLENFLCLNQAERLERLEKNAHKRFLQKVGFCRKRLESSSWKTVLHALTLEVLGYRRNRAPMSTIAQRTSLEEFSGCDIEALYKSQSDSWKLAGLRPANHPRLRLEQYKRLNVRQPDWQTKLQAWAHSLRLQKGTFSTDTRYYRKLKCLPRVRRELAENILADSIGGTRLDTWMIDAVIPLFAVNEPIAWFPLWFHWYAGDMPEAVDTVLKQSEIPPSPQPRNNGWSQAALQLFLESGL